jgi:ketosteroid isomerase-like protein
MFGDRAPWGEIVKVTRAMTRRILFQLAASAAAASALAPQAAQAQARPGASSDNEMIVRKWYQLWATDKRNWPAFDALLADDFNFTSAAPDDHIDKIAFKKKCWESQIDHIKGFDLELVMAKDDLVLVKYLCQTTGGKAFRNVELHRLRSGKIASIECYFGGPGYPTAAEAQKG